MLRVRRFAEGWRSSEGAEERRIGHTRLQYQALPWIEDLTTGEKGEAACGPWVPEGGGGGWIRGVRGKRQHNL